MTPQEQLQIEQQVLGLLQQAASMTYRNDHRLKLLESALELQRQLPEDSYSQMSVMYERRLRANPQYEALRDAIRACPSIDENGYYCEKSEAIKAVRAHMGIE